MKGFSYGRRMLNEILLLVCVSLLLLNGPCSGFLSNSIKAMAVDKMRRSYVEMAAVLNKPMPQSQVRTFVPYDQPGRKGRAAILPSQYMTKEMSSRFALTRRLSSMNRRDLVFNDKMRKGYKDLKHLTPQDEQLAGRIIQLGIRLEKIHEALQNKSGEVTQEQWAAACRLSVEQLQRYLRAASDARSRLVIHNLNFADSMCRRLLEHHKGARDISYMELVSEGMKGLMKAAMRYNGSARFVTYAFPFVQDALLRGLTKLRPGSCLNHRSMLVYHRAKRMRNSLRTSLQRLPTLEEVSTAMHMSPKALQNIMTHVEEQSRTLSANVMLEGGQEEGEGQGESSLLELCPSLGSPSSSGEVAWRADLQRALTCLTAVEKRTLLLRFGLDGGLGCQGGRTLERTAELMCLSREAVRKVIFRAMDKLQHSDVWESVRHTPDKDGEVKMVGDGYLNMNQISSVHG